MSVCCRVVVRDRHGLWSAVTENISTRGCRIVTARLLRPGTLLHITFSSDLFPEDLEAVGEAAWSTGDRLGVVFSGDPSGAAARSLSAWLSKVLEHGAMPDSSTTFRVVPSVRRAPPLPVRLARMEPPPPVVAEREFVPRASSDVRPSVAAQAAAP